MNLGEVAEDFKFCIRIKKKLDCSRIKEKGVDRINNKQMFQKNFEEILLPF